MPESPERTALYRLYDAEHDLLYVGISRKPEERFKAHEHDKRWWHCVRYVDLTWFESYPQARRAENAAHLSERPPYNGMGHTGLGWDIPTVRYDDSTEQAAVRRNLLAELRAGLHASGSRIWPFHVARKYGYSRPTVVSAMDDLAREGHLKFCGRTFIVADR
jgi:hypothetical protein